MKISVLSILILLGCIYLSFALPICTNPPNGNTNDQRNTNDQKNKRKLSQSSSNTNSDKETT